MSKAVNAASERHEAQMLDLAEFCGLDEIRYKDKGNKEEYVLVKDGKKLRVSACGNKYDGGFLCVEGPRIKAMGVEADGARSAPSA